MKSTKIILLIIILVMIALISNAQDCHKEVIEKLKFTTNAHTEYNSSLWFSVDVLKKITPKELIHAQRSWMSEEQFDCLVNGATKQQNQLCFVVNVKSDLKSKSVLSTKYIYMDFNVYRSLIYQK